MVISEQDLLKIHHAPKAPSYEGKESPYRSVSTNAGITSLLEAEGKTDNMLA